MANETQAQTAPAAAPAAPAEPAVVTANTKVHVGGKEYEVTGLSTAAGLEIYQALPAASQERARTTAAVITTYASIQKVAQANGMNPTQLATSWLATVGETEAARTARSQFTDAQKKAVGELKVLGLDARNVAGMVPGGGALVGAVDVGNGVLKIGGVVTGGIGAVGDGVINGNPRTWNLLTTMGTEAWGKLFGYGTGAPSDQALAFASAVEALHLESTNTRHGQAMFDWNPLDDKKSQVGSNLLEYGSAGLGWVGEWLAQAMPGIAKYIIAAKEFLFYKGDKEHKPKWSEFVDAAEHKILEAKQKTPATAKRFAELADEAMWDKEAAIAKDGMLAAKEVAGLKSEGLAEVATAPKTTFRDTNGVDVTLDRGKVTSQVTPVQRLQEKWNDVTGDGPLHEKALTVAGTAAGVGLGLNGVRGLGEGMVRQHLIQPANAAEAAMKTHRKLAGFEDAKGNHVPGKIEALEAHLNAQKSAKTSKWQIWKTDDTQIQALKDKAAQALKEAGEHEATAAQRSATAWDFTKTAATPIKEINDGSKWKAIWNAPRHAMRVVGDGVAATAQGAWGVAKGAVNMAAVTVMGTKDVAVGTVKGAHTVVNDEAVSKGATLLERFGIGSGKWMTRGLNVLAPVFSAGQFAGDVGRGDTSGAVVHGSQTAAVTGTMVAFKVAKLGVGRATPILGGLVSGGEFVNAAAHGDGKGMKSAGIDLGIMGGGAAIGAGIIAVPLLIASAPISVPVILGAAATGATVGGFAVAGRAIYNMFHGEKVEPAKAQPIIPPAARPTGVQPLHPGLQVAGQEYSAAAERARMVEVAAGASEDVMCARMAVCRPSTQIGATVRALPASAGGNAPMAATRPTSYVS